MSNKILINAVDSEECRIANVIDNQLEEFHIETAAREIIQGNIYKGVIIRAEPSLQAVFVNYGGDRHGFLQKQEIHSDYYQDNLTGNTSIDNILQQGQHLLVQVTKDPIMNKGAMLTTFISLPGRYMVLMPGSKNLGISRKIKNDVERTRLKELISSMKIPEGFGLIVRTAGIGASKSELSKDLKNLLRFWQNINKKGIKTKECGMLYKERNLAVRVIRDYFTSDVNEVLIDNESIYNEVKDFLKIISPKSIKLVKLYSDPKPLFTKYQLENQIASIFKRNVSLKSGGTIVIEQTEALVSIDVNSRKATKKKSIEQTALQTNLEAAEEIARQLRLRDLGGLIVIDFIDMRETKHKSQVERLFKSCLKTDKARTKIGRLSTFGLMELSRQRISPPIEFGNFETCRHCNGRGMTPSTEMLSLNFLRRLRLETLKADTKIVRGIVPPVVADYLLNKKRREILELEQRRELLIRIEGNSSMLPGEAKILYKN